MSTPGVRKSIVVKPIIEIQSSVVRKGEPLLCSRDVIRKDGTVYSDGHIDAPAKIKPIPMPIAVPPKAEPPFKLEPETAEE